MPKEEKLKKTLKDLVRENKDFKVRGQIKAQAIADKKEGLINRGNKVKRIEKGEEYEIKIHDVKTTEVKGQTCVEVYAQAWKDGVQIGFGKDGSVDIERFRIFNPPILVPDENGDVVIERKIPIGFEEYEIQEARFREDPEEAVRQSVIQTVADIGKRGSNNIQEGKVGRTTSTFYPYVDARLRAGSTNDRPPQSSDWDIAHDKTDCTGFGGGLDSSSTTAEIGIALLHSNFRVYVSRGGFFFDTSAIDTDDIDSAVFSLYVVSKRDTYNDTYDYINVVEATPASDATIVSGDFDQMGAVNNPTQGATAIDIGAITTSAYNNWTLNATGEGWINKTGDTTLAVREGHDIEDVYAGDGSGEDYTDITVSMSEETGTTQDPKLVVEHSPSSVDVTVSASVVAMTASLPTATPVTGVTETPSAQEVTASLPSPTTIQGATETPSAQVATFSIPTPEIFTPDALVTPDAVVATFSLPSPSVLLDMVVAVATQVATFASPGATVALGITISPNVQILTFTTLTPDVITVSVVTPDAQALTFSIPTATVTGQTLVTPSVQEATFSIPSVSVLLGALITPDPVTATFVVNDPAIRASYYQTKYTAQGDTYGVKYT